MALEHTGSLLWLEYKKTKRSVAFARATGRHAQRDRMGVKRKLYLGFLAKIVSDIENQYKWSLRLSTIHYFGLLLKTPLSVPGAHTEN